MLSKKYWSRQTLSCVRSFVLLALLGVSALSSAFISHFGIAQEAWQERGGMPCFRVRKQKARPQKQSRGALSTSLLPGLLRNFEVANMENFQPS